MLIWIWVKEFWPTTHNPGHISILYWFSAQPSPHSLYCVLYLLETRATCVLGLGWAGLGWVVTRKILSWRLLLMRGRESPLVSDLMFVSLVHWSFLASVSRNSSVSKIQVTCTWFVICKVCCLHQYNLKEEKWMRIHAFFLQYPRVWTLLAPGVASPETWPWWPLLTSLCKLK